MQLLRRLVRLTEQTNARYAAPLLGIAAVTACIGAVLSRTPVVGLFLLYLPVVLLAAVRLGRGPAVAASAASFVAYDWFFVPPAHTLAVAEAEEWIALLLFLVVAVVAGHLAAEQRERAEEALRREREAAGLYELGRLLNGQDDLDTALAAAVAHLRTTLGLAGCAVLVPDRPERGGRVRARATAGAVDATEVHEDATAEWMAPPQPPLAAAAHERHWIRVRQPWRSAASDRRPAAPAPTTTHLPLRAGTRRVGVLRLAAPSGRPAWTREEQRLLDAACDQIGRTVERDRLRQEAIVAEVLRQTDQVHRTLLASVSHDLRTPLAVIKASAENLADRTISWSDDDRAAAAGAIEQEADRLHRLVENLLDLSRIEAGRLQTAPAWYPLEPLVDDVLARLGPLLAGHCVIAKVPDDLPPAFLDYVLFSQALSNLVENAAKYSPPGSTIAVTARVQGGALRVAVRDDGPGIPAAALPHVFDRFYRVAGGDRAGIQGTGLGLAVARGLVEAHGGAIGVQSPPPDAPAGATGAEFTINLPLSDPARSDAGGRPVAAGTAR